MHSLTILQPSCTTGSCRISLIAICYPILCFVKPIVGLNSYNYIVLTNAKEEKSVLFMNQFKVPYYQTKSMLYFSM